MSTPEVAQEQKVPTKEELIAFLEEQIEVKTKQAQLQELNTKLAVLRAEELKALQFIAQMTNPSVQEADRGQPHIVTQEDLDNNPELVEAGVQAGDEILIPSSPAPEEKTSSRKLKK